MDIYHHGLCEFSFEILFFHVNCGSVRFHAALATAGGLLQEWNWNAIQTIAVRVAQKEIIAGINPSFILHNLRLFQDLQRLILLQIQCLLLLLSQLPRRRHFACLLQRFYDFVEGLLDL